MLTVTVPRGVHATSPQPLEWMYSRTCKTSVIQNMLTVWAMQNPAVVETVAAA